MFVVTSAVGTGSMSRHEDQDALNIAIGQFIMAKLSDVPGGNPMLLSLALNLDGILRITIKEGDTGLQESITIDNDMSTRLGEEGIDDAKSRIGALLDEDSD